MVVCLIVAVRCGACEVVMVRGPVRCDAGDRKAGSSGIVKRGKGRGKRRLEIRFRF